MEEKIFYRVGTYDNSGMWYDSKGNFHGAINTPAFFNLKCNKVDMPYCNYTKGYLSVAESIEELKQWFTDDDMKILEPLGFRVLKYKSCDYKYHNKNKHWLINENTSFIIND